VCEIMDGSGHANVRETSLRETFFDFTSFARREVFKCSNIGISSKSVKRFRSCGCRNLPIPLTWPLAYTTACTTSFLMAKLMGMGKFPPPQLRNPLTDFDEIRTLELSSSQDHPPHKISLRSDDVGDLKVCHFCVSFFVVFGPFVTRTFASLIRF